MKRTYMKPEILFESFSLSANIAAGCEITDLKDDKLYYPPLGHVFADTCEFPLISEGGDGEHNGICYHTLSSGINVFNS